MITSLLDLRKKGSRSPNEVFMLETKAQRHRRQKTDWARRDRTNKQRIRETIKQKNEELERTNEKYKLQINMLRSCSSTYESLLHQHHCRLKVLPPITPPQTATHRTSCSMDDVSSMTSLEKMSHTAEDWYESSQHHALSCALAWESRDGEEKKKKKKKKMKGKERKTSILDKDVISDGAENDDVARDDNFPSARSDAVVHRSFDVMQSSDDAKNNLFSFQSDVVMQGNSVTAPCREDRSRHVQPQAPTFGMGRVSGGSCQATLHPENVNVTFCHLPDDVSVMMTLYRVCNDDGFS